MKRRLLFVMMILGCLGAHAQLETDTLVSLTKVNYVGITELAAWSQFAGEQPEDKVEIVEDGIAITNSKLQSQSWQPQLIVVPDGSFDLVEGHNYIVRLTMKVPSDGSFYVNIGTWVTNIMALAPVKASDEFQIIDVEYPEYKNNVAGCHVVLGLGWIPGTTILKEVEVLEKQNGGGTAIKPVMTVNHDDAIYNLSGQRVSPSNKGIVIRNGRKVVN